MSIGNGFRLFLFLLLSGIAAAFAQEIPAPHSTVTPQIHLDVVVTPKSGAPVANLKQQDFTLLDNKVSQPITSFQAVTGTQAPVGVVLLIDAVNTSFQTIAYERGQIATFLQANGGHLARPLALAILTDDGIKMQEGFSSDGNAINAALEQDMIGLRTIPRSQGFYGAEDRLQLSLKALHGVTMSLAPHPGRKLILWVSPGWPILSGPNIQLDSKESQQIFATIVGVSAELRTARITLYSVDALGVNEGLARTDYYQGFVRGVSKPGDANIGNLSLQVLAVQSGGLALSSSGVAELLQRCESDLDAYYELTFNALPAEKPNEYHHVEIKVATPGLIARTRQGYYAQP